MCWDNEPRMTLSRGPQSQDGWSSSRHRHGCRHSSRGWRGTGTRIHSWNYPHWGSCWRSTTPRTSGYSCPRKSQRSESRTGEYRWRRSKVKRRSGYTSSSLAQRSNSQGTPSRTIASCWSCCDTRRCQPSTGTRPRTRWWYHPQTLPDTHSCKLGSNCT